MQWAPPVQWTPVASWVPPVMSAGGLPLSFNPVLASQFVGVVQQPSSFVPASGGDCTNNSWIEAPPEMRSRVVGSNTSGWRAVPSFSVSSMNALCEAPESRLDTGTGNEIPENRVDNVIEGGIPEDYVDSGAGSELPEDSASDTLEDNGILSPSIVGDVSMSHSRVGGELSSPEVSMSHSRSGVVSSSSSDSVHDTSTPRVIGVKSVEEVSDCQSETGDDVPRSKDGEDLGVAATESAEEADVSRSGDDVSCASDASSRPSRSDVSCAGNASCRSSKSDVECSNASSRPSRSEVECSQSRCVSPSRSDVECSRPRSVSVVALEKTTPILADDSETVDAEYAVAKSDNEVVITVGSKKSRMRRKMRNQMRSEGLSFVRVG